MFSLDDLRDLNQQTKNNEEKKKKRYIPGTQTTIHVFVLYVVFIFDHVREVFLAFWNGHNEGFCIFSKLN